MSDKDKNKYKYKSTYTDTDYYSNDYNDNDYNFERFEGPTRYSKSPQDPSITSRANKEKKRSLAKRIAAIIGAGALFISGIYTISEYSKKIPEETESIHNTTIYMDESNEATLASLEEEFSSLSENSSSADINAFAKKLFSFNIGYLKSKLIDTYNSYESSKASSIEIHRDLVNIQSDPDLLYYALVPDSYRVSSRRISLKGKLLKGFVDNIAALQDFDVYLDGYDKFKKAAENTFETLDKDFIISYNKEKNTMTSYETIQIIDDPETTNTEISLDENDELDR